MQAVQAPDSFPHRSSLREPKAKPAASSDRCNLIARSASPAPGIEGQILAALMFLVVLNCLLLLSPCLAILDYFDRRRRRRPRTAPQDDDDSDGDFEPGPRTTTASARRRSPRLARQNRIGTRGEAPHRTISNVLEGIAALSAVVYTVGVALGLPPY